MPLTNDQVNLLQDAVTGYAFPCAYYDFVNDIPDYQPNMIAVENLIQADLTSANAALVKNGLSNVLYWGYAQVGFRDVRVNRFRMNVTNDNLIAAATLFDNMVGDGLVQIRDIGLPEFSGMSFVSKVRMFLNPENYVTLDKQILKMNEIPVPTVLNEIAFGQNETRIRISGPNVIVYNNWCGKCVHISNTYYDGQYRAADIERGFFALIQRRETQRAAEMLSDA